MKLCHIVLCLFLFFNLCYARGEAGQSFLCAGLSDRGTDRALAKVARPTTGKDHPVVIFAAFRGAFPEGAPAPEYARSIFDPNVEGSFSHFYREMSFGALTIEGAWLPKIYLSKKGIESYERGGYGLFNREILEAADAEIDFSQYDNDGPDGKPNSGDDDGNVDFTFIDILGDIPRDFINASATGTASLGLPEKVFMTNDPQRSFGRISIQDGTIQRVLGFHHAVGSMAHEYGHTLGLPDLYNSSFLNDQGQSPENDSAGIGAWGLMGYGAQGWNGDDGPNPFSAWEREQLGWIGRKNDRLVIVTGRLSNVAIDDLAMRGPIYKLPANDQEYFLVENRQASGSYYNRNIPQSGLLIWHINLLGNIGDETWKMVDLECADGLFADRGYPDGKIPDPVAGKDNLDFWAHDAIYSKAHDGNTGDATDIFDGQRYTEFNWKTNPNSNGYDVGDHTFGTGHQGLFSPISVTNIRRRGSTMLADMNAEWSGSITGKSVWQGGVRVVGDLTIEAGAELAIVPGTVVNIEASDNQSGGLDPSQIEIRVAGTLKTLLGRSGAVTSFIPKGRWSGIQLLGRPARVELRDVQIEGAVDGISGSEVGRLQLNNFTIRGSSRNGIHLSGMNGTVQLQTGTIEENGENGISIDGGGIVDIRSVVVQKNAGTGITTVGVRLHLEGASIHSNGSGGIRSDRGTLTIQKSRILQNTGGGVTARKMNVECVDNLFDRNGEGYVLEIAGATGGVIRQNRFTLEHGLGVRLVESLISPVLPMIDNLFADGDIGLSLLSSNPILSGNTFQGNRIGLLCEGESVPVLTFNTFINNEWAVRNTASQTIPATNNWWGTDKAVEIGGRISGSVNWHPFLIVSPKDSPGIILGQGFPNPFTHTITIPYQMSYRASIHVILSIYDTTGQLIKVLGNETVQQGRYNAIWDGRDEKGREVANGMYICKIAAYTPVPTIGTEDLFKTDVRISRIMIVR